MAAGPANDAERPADGEERHRQSHQLATGELARHAYPGQPGDAAAMERRLLDRLGAPELDYVDRVDAVPLQAGLDQLPRARPRFAHQERLRRQIGETQPLS